MISNKILKNIFSLSAAEFLSKILIFLYTAYLARTILTTGLGSINFAQALSTYLLLVITTGLDSYGIKELARNRNNMKSIVDTLFSVRLVLSVIAYLVLALIVLLLHKELEVKHIILIFGLTILAQVNWMNWVFMAIERMEVVAIRLIITSLINLAGIFLFVKSPDDTWLAALIIASSQLLNALWMIVYYVKKYHTITITINIKEWIKHLKKALPIGLTFLIITLYNNIGLILVGVMISTDYLYQTGILGAGIKLMLILLAPLLILQQSFFPQLSRANTENERFELLNKYTKITFLLGAFLATFLFYYSEMMIVFVFGRDFIESAEILKILSPGVLLMYINSSFMISLIAWGEEDKVLKTVLTAAVINLTLNLIFIPFYGMYAVVFTTLITEFIVFLGLTYSIYGIVRKTFISRIIILGIISLGAFGIPFLLIDLQWYLNLFISWVVFSILVLVTKQIDIGSLKNILFNNAEQ